MKRFVLAALLTGLLGATFAGCHHKASFQGHSAYARSTHSGSGKPAGASGVTCAKITACDYWLCTCADGTVVASAVCDTGWCLGAAAACLLACPFFGDGTFDGSAQGGPGSGIGAPDTTDGSGAGGSSGSCGAAGDACSSGSDCCDGSCDSSSGTCGTSSSCSADGASCSSNSECCNGSCDSTSSTCGSSSSCSSAGTSCSADSECCSGTCDTSTSTCG